MAGAVEEILRYEPPILFLSRIVREDLELAGQQLSKDEMIHLSLSSANRDPDAYPDPDRFDVTRWAPATALRSLESFPLRLTPA